jgi:excisionase family DNA binding protein
VVAWFFIIQFQHGESAPACQSKIYQDCHLKVPLTYKYHVVISLKHSKMSDLESNALTPRQVAKALNLSESTVRRLCDRGQLPSRTTAGGHRRITVGSVLAYARERGLVVTDYGALGAAAAGGRPADSAELARRFLGAARAGDHRTAEVLLKERIIAGDEPAAVFDDIVAPALHELGALWERGVVEVYEEHRASGAVILALASLQSMLQREAIDSPIAMATALSGDNNLIAPTMATITLRACGYAVVALGSDTPATSIAKAVENLKPLLLAVSLSHVGSEDGAVGSIEIISRVAVQHDCRLALGGRGLSKAIRRRVQADFFGDTMGHLANYARKVRERL